MRVDQGPVCSHNNVLLRFKTHQYSIHNYPDSPFQFILRYEGIRMTILESITLLEGNTKGSVIENMGKYRAHKNVVGAMYLEGVYVPFPAWSMGLWNSMCVLASSGQGSEWSTSMSRSRPRNC